MYHLSFSADKLNLTQEEFDERRQYAEHAEFDDGEPLGVLSMLAKMHISTQYMKDRERVHKRYKKQSSKPDEVYSQPYHQLYGANRHQTQEQTQNQPQQQQTQSQQTPAAPTANEVPSNPSTNAQPSRTPVRRTPGPSAPPTRESRRNRRRRRPRNADITLQESDAVDSNVLNDSRNARRRASWSVNTNNAYDLKRTPNMEDLNVLDKLNGKDEDRVKKRDRNVSRSRSRRKEKYKEKEKESKDDEQGIQDEYPWAQAGYQTQGQGSHFPRRSQ